MRAKYNFPLFYVSGLFETLKATCIAALICTLHNTLPQFRCYWWVALLTGLGAWSWSTFNTLNGFQPEFHSFFELILFFSQIKFWFLFIIMWHNKDVNVSTDTSTFCSFLTKDFKSSNSDQNMDNSPVTSKNSFLDSVIF